MNTILGILKSTLSWIFSHKRLVFIYIPSILSILFSLYVGFIYLSWRSDKSDALDKLSRYKLLIDRTEEMRKGMAYSYSDVDATAKVVGLPTRIYDRNNEIIGEFFEEKREIVPYDSIPQWIVKGVIASEDREFYNHKGVSYKGIFRAFFVNLANFRVVQGGSTITQQLAKVLFTDMERSLKRKVYEAFCALEIERHYDKQDILSMYLNLIYFGNGAYGVESASKMFFGQSVNKLNEVECSMVVATISSPKSYSPISNLKNSIRKTRRILTSLVDAGFLKEARAAYQYKRFLSKWDVQYDKENIPKESLIGSFIYSSYRVNRAPFFNEHIRRILIEKFGENVLKKGGMSIYTTIDSKAQDVALASLRDGIQKQRQFHLARAKRIRNAVKKKAEEEKAKNIEGGFVALNPYSGEILSYVGGSAFTSSNQLDHVRQIRRQPGSSFKPLVYTAALESRKINPSTVFIDEKKTFKGDYSPRNYSNEYTGPIIVREALRKSVNIIAVKVLDKVGYKRLFYILQKSLDLDSSELDKRFGKTLSIALGTYELSPLENSVLHSVILNGGDFIEPYGIRYIKDYSGNTVWNKEEEVRKRVLEKRKNIGKIIDPVASAITVSMLKGVFEEGGTAYWAAKSRGISFPIAGKTGTSTDFNDAWFVGYTADRVAAVWVGNKTGAISLGKGRAGGVVSAPVWANYISRIYGSTPPGGFTVPREGVSRETICKHSGLVARPGAHPVENIITQIYYSGTEPGEYCKMDHSLDKKNETE